MDDWKLEPARDSGLRMYARTTSLHRESGLMQTFGHVVWWSGVRAFLKVYNRMSVEGAERLPREPPFILVANHSSHIDVFMLGAHVSARHRDRVFPLAAGDVFFEDPARAVFASGLLNALPIWRKRKTPEALRLLRARLLDERCGYILFPEGARSRDGKMLPFKAGIGMLVAGTDVPVIPCYLEGAFRAMPPGVRVPRPKKLVLRVGNAQTFTDIPNKRDGWDVVSARLRAEIERLEAMTWS